MTVFIGVISNSVGLVADLVYSYFYKRLGLIFWLTVANSLLTSSKFVFPGVSLARRARLLTRSMQPPPQIQPPSVSGYANTPYSRSSHSWYEGCLPEGYPDLFSSAHLPPRLSSKHNPP